MDRYLDSRFRGVFIAYLAILVFFSMKLHSEWWVIIMQLVLSTEFYIAFNVLRKQNCKVIIMFSGLLLGLNIIFVRLLFDIFGIHAFGPNPVDSINYMDYSLKFHNYTVEAFILKLLHFDYDIDDLGMFLIGYVAAIIGEDEHGYIFVLSVLNVITVMFSTHIMYLNACCYLKRSTSKIVATIWGLHQGFLALAVFGLKENFFLLIVVCTIYYIIKIIKQNKVTYILCGVMFIFICLLFRLAVGVQFIMAFFLTLATLNRNKRVWVLFVGTIVGSLLLYYIDFIIISLGGSGGFDNFILMAENVSRQNAINRVWGIQLLYSVIGSPASFIDEISFSHLFTFCSLFTSFMSIFFVAGLIDMIINGDKIHYFLIIYWMLGVAMLTIVLRGGDFRYSVIYLPTFLIMAGIGFENRNRYKYLTIFSFFMIFMIFSIIYLWNK